MRRAGRAALALVLLATTPGCLSGFIYTHTIVPLDVNLAETPVHTERARGSWNSFRYYIRVDWGSDGIGDVAKEHGFTRIDYADLETLSVLGIWTQRFAHVYGERAAP
jgi:hypothetical protein